MASKYLTPEAKKYIENQIYSRGEITTEEVMDIVRPHFMFDMLSAREQQIRRVAHRIMSSMRSTDHTRTCFAIDKYGESTYINIENSSSIEDLDKVREQLGNKFDGLNKSLKKVNERANEVMGQTSLFDNERIS